MSRDLLSLVLLLLAVFGVLGLLTRLGRAALRLGLNAAEATATSGAAEVSQRRGDITGFMERRESGVALRRARRRNLLALAAYGLVLVIPLFTPVTRELYAAAALLWLLPRRSIRPPVELPHP
ncbi:hypothetical protein [Longimicrobium sp.]|uniref:hypothetical protein n=1 Tax=Longimicrobium sp. TaxID=2029185 RepID=UPI002E300444|nr:hypothetical protein [Longimicrobium sp.]HEX6041216.1 hypothetical protein [Longimicrobium sp.]